MIASNDGVASSRRFTVSLLAVGLTALIGGSSPVLAQALTCQVACYSTFPTEVGWFKGEGRTCNESQASASSQCAAQGGYAHESSCVNSPGRAETALRCRKVSSATDWREIHAESNQEAWRQAQQICKDFCAQFGSQDDGVTCQAQGGACRP